MIDLGVKFQSFQLRYVTLVTFSDHTASLSSGQHGQRGTGLPLATLRSPEDW